MPRSGEAHLPLHGGKAPRWLFARMVRLAREIAVAVAEEHGPDEMLRRLADPFWFQAFGCALGFDWHSSGVTTTACGALKEGLKGLGRHCGLYVAGGKGGASRKTSGEIEAACDAISLDASPLVRASRIAAKVDSAAVQHGYQLYHHCFLFAASGRWAVVQQGLNEANRYARRYHWLSEGLARFDCEPHAAVCCDARGDGLNMVAKESGGAREASVLAAREKPAGKPSLPGDTPLLDLMDGRDAARAGDPPRLVLPPRHDVRRQDILTPRLARILLSAYEAQPKDYEELLLVEGVGPKTVRALALVAELMYGAPPSFSDPARFSFAHGGKDGHPYPVDRAGYDRMIAILRRALDRSKADFTEKRDALRRLAAFEGAETQRPRRPHA